MLPLLMAGLSAASSIYGGIQQKKAAEAQAQQKERQSRELLVRANINKRAQSTTSQIERADISNRTASAGFTGDTSLATLNMSLAKEFETALNIDREAAYERQSLALEADAMRRAGKAAKTAGYIEAGSSILSGYGQFEKAGGMTGVEDRLLANTSWSI